MVNGGRENLHPNPKTLNQLPHEDPNNDVVSILGVSVNQGSLTGGPENKGVQACPCPTCFPLEGSFDSVSLLSNGHYGAYNMDHGGW